MRAKAQDRLETLAVVACLAALLLAVLAAT